MFKIQSMKFLNENIFQMVVEAPMVARACLPGQFVIVRSNAEAERIPLTICDYDRRFAVPLCVFSFGIIGFPLVYLS